MMRNRSLQRALLGLALGFAFGLWALQTQAAPAFARQTGLACQSCHFQNFPAINAFGRAFRANGYTMRGTQTLIEGDDISLPSSLNASIITKIRYQLSDAVDDNRGEVQWPDEAAFLIGGRAAENVGFLMELGLGPVGSDTDTGDGSISGDTNGNGIMDPGENWVADTGSGEGDTHGTFLSTKFHFNVGERFAVIPFSTDGLGVGYGFELLNTGAQRSQRPIENRKGFSAGQLLGTASGEATGVSFVYHQSDLFLNYTHWSPTWGNVNADIFGGLAHYLRAAYMPNIGGWDTGIGFSLMDGSVESGETNPATETSVEGWGVDLQAQGSIGTLPFGLYASYGVAPKSSATEVNHYNPSTLEDEEAVGIVGKLGVQPGKTQLYAGFGSINTGTWFSQYTVGVQYMVAQNIKLELFNVNASGSNEANDYTMLMLFAGF